MAGGFLTKSLVGISMFALFTFFAAFFMADMANNYGVTNLNSFNNGTEIINNVEANAEDYTSATDSGTIQQESFGDASYVGQISAEKEKTSTIAIFGEAIDSINDIFTIPAFFWTVITTIIVILSASAIGFFFFGRYM